MVFYSLLDSKVIGKRYLKFIVDITVQIKNGKETNQQNSIFASLSGKLIGSF